MVEDVEQHQNKINWLDFIYIHQLFADKCGEAGAVQEEKRGNIPKQRSSKWSNMENAKTYTDTYKNKIEYKKHQSTERSRKT